MRSFTLPALAAAVLFSFGGAALAQQRQGGQMQNMPGMDHSQTQGMDMKAMMAQCAQMRQQMRPGMAMSADMRQMMSQCDQMDRSMGTAPQQQRR